MSETSIKTKCLYLQRIALRLFKPRVPRSLWIGVTYRCQCKCTHCFLGPQLNKGMSEMTFDEICRIIESARHAGFMEVCFFGGEPLLREDLFDLIRFTTKKGLLSAMFTNGILIDAEKAGELKRSGLSLCNVSLDSASPEDHDRFRGHEGCFEKAVAGIRHLRESGIKCNIWTYANKRAARDPELKALKAVIELGRKLDIQGVNILFPISAGNMADRRESVLNSDEREHVRKLYAPPFVEMEFSREDCRCHAGFQIIYISPAGDVSPCPVIAESYGNIFQEPLISIIERVNREFVESKITKCGDCIINVISSEEKLDEKLSMGNKEITSQQK